MTHSISDRKENWVMIHSAQQLKGTDPDIIAQEGECYPVQAERKIKFIEESEDRDRAITAINSVISRAKTSKKEFLMPGGVIIYYNNQNFVVKSIPTDRDDYNRLSPILSYGYFPEKNWQTEDFLEEWSNIISESVNSFVNEIGRSFDDHALSEMKKGLKEVQKMRLKKIQKEEIVPSSIDLILLSLAFIFPILIGWIIQNQVPQMVQGLESQDYIKEMSSLMLQQVIQNLIILLAFLAAINNVILIIIAKLSVKLPIK